MSEKTAPNRSFESEVLEVARVLECGDDLEAENTRLRAKVIAYEAFHGQIVVLMRNLERFTNTGARMTLQELLRSLEKRIVGE